MTDKGPVTRSQGSKSTPSLQDLTAERVAEYLRAHPDFLIAHPDLLEVLYTPEQAGGNVVDFQHAMV